MCLKSYLQLFLRALLTIPKKILSFIIFPLVYPLRNKIYRDTNAYNSTRWNIPKVLKKNKGWKLFVWLFFDDSIYSDFRKDYHPYKHQSKIFNFLGKIFRTEDFFKSWYWSGFRNSSNNLSHLLAYKLGVKKGIIKECGEHMEIRLFSSDKVRPYAEFKIKQYVINIGWLSNGKFEGPKIRKTK